MIKIFHSFFRIPLFLYTICFINYSNVTATNIDSIIQITNNSEDDSFKVENLITAGEDFLNSKPRLSIDCAQKANLLSKKIDFSTGVIESNHLLGKAYTRLGDYQKALKIYENTLKKINPPATGSFKLLVDNYNGTAKVLYFLGQYDSSLHYSILSSNLSDSINYIKGLAVTYNNIALIHDCKEDMDKALEYYNKFLNIVKLIDNKEEIAGALSNIGNIHYFRNDYERALDYYRKSLLIRIQINNKQGIASCYNNMAMIYDHRRKTDTATKYYTKAYSILEKINNKKGMAVILNNIGEMYSETGQLDKAIGYSKKSLNIALSINANNNIKNAYKALSDTYSRMKNFKKAYKYFKKYSEIKDSLFNESKTRQITEMQTIYETEKKEKELKLSNTRNKILEKNAQIQKQYQKLLFVIISTLFLLSVLLFFFFRLKSKSLKQNKLYYEQQKKLVKLEMINKDNINKRLLAKKQQQETIIEHKNKELTILTLNNINKNKILYIIRNNLEKILRNNVDIHIQATVFELAKFVNVNIDADKDWKQFKYNFDNTHKNFFERLKTKYPELTLNEHKLCAYLKINLSSKEIAHIMNITTSAVNKSRQRLRKKLRISPDINLNSFLNRI